MSAAELGLALPIFLACGVEAVEALTIVLAVGTTRGWCWTLAGAAGALLTLGVVVGALGPAVTSLPLDLLRVLVGAVLLAIGAQWLRKAVLRAAGRKAMHDENAIYARTAGAASRERRSDGVDRYAFTTSYMGVLVEGLEVVVVVVSFAADGHGLGIAVAAALAAVLAVALAGVALRAPLSRVPENTLKLCVGVMLTSFGAFWLCEGAGLAVSEVLLPAIILAVLACALGAARGLRLTRAAGSRA
ncbi:MAG TPA: hypothetical protein VEJ23_05610 [Solirubrobacteraceae bacterium]|nr:hypothetical protein [Solirubrobacteraceae bacterium]